MNCKHCGKENRPEARYCRFCGKTIESASPQKKLIGKDSIVPQLEILDKKIQVAKMLAQNGTRMGMDCLILGDSGTGKNFIAQLIADKMVSAGLTKQPPKKIDAADWSDFYGDFDKNISALKDGILLITNAQKLFPTSKSREVNQLDKLFTRMRNIEGAPIVLLCGTLNDIMGFLENNKDVHRLFEFEFKLDAFNIENLTGLALSILKEKYKVDPNPDVDKKLNAHFAWYMRQQDLGHINGHLSERKQGFGRTGYKYCRVLHSKNRRTDTCRPGQLCRSPKRKGRNKSHYPGHQRQERERIHRKTA